MVERAYDLSGYKFVNKILNQYYELNTQQAKEIYQILGVRI
jgi:hypothetical protein